ncbi:MAG: polysaccharide biosynthesis tyrosine autokinase [Bacteroidia bacterium]
MAKKKISPINEEFDLKLLVTIAQKNALILFLFLTSALLIALLIIRYTPPLFEATGVLQISEQNTARSVLNDATLKNFSDPNNKLASSIELIRSKVIIERVLKGMPVKVSYYAKGEFLTNELYKNSPFWIEYRLIDSSIVGVPIQITFKNADVYNLSFRQDQSLSTADLKTDRWIKLQHLELNVHLANKSEFKNTNSLFNESTLFFKINDLKSLTESIIRDVQVTPLNSEAKTIQIKIKDRNNLKAADIVNGMCSEYNKYDLERNSEAADKILEFIDQTIANVDVQLSNSENSLEDFKKKNKIVVSSLDNSHELDQLDRLQNELYSLDHELNIYTKIKREIQKDLDVSSFLLSLIGKSTNPVILNQITKLQDLNDQLEQIKLQATENSEVYKAMLIKVKSQKDLLAQTIRNEEFRIRTNRDDREKDLHKLEATLGLMPERQSEYARLQRVFSVNEKFYSMLLEKKAEFSITRAGYVPQNIILQEAKYGAAPISPKKPLIYSACLLIGFVISLILIIVKYLLYNEINALEEVGQYTDATLLGIVPKYKREIPISQLLVDKNPKSVISEAFRSIRTNLQFISNTEGAKLIAVTSTISGEGKTFNAINLAGVIAFSGLKVVILDLDMRKPKIHLGFNVENNRGISTLLIGKDTLEGCILKSSLANLDFITAGPIPPNPSELIINPKMNLLLKELKEMYDIIIIDLPPVGIVSDGIPMMQMADYPLYILRANYSRKMFIAQINKLMTENKIHNLSVILNGVEMSRLKYGYGYGYSYGYGYGYGYSYGYGYYEDDNEPKGFIDKLRSAFIRKP